MHQQPHADPFSMHFSWQGSSPNRNSLVCPYPYSANSLIDVMEWSAKNFFWSLICCNYKLACYLGYLCTLGVKSDTFLHIPWPLSVQVQPQSEYSMWVLYIKAKKIWDFFSSLVGYPESNGKWHYWWLSNLKLAHLHCLACESTKLSN